MKLFLSVRIILLVILITIGFTRFFSINSYISICLGFLTYLVAYIASFLINYYPDPVLNKTLNTGQLAKLISRKFYRAMGFKYLIVCFGLYFFIKNGFSGMGLLLGVAIAIVSLSFFQLHIKHKPVASS
jgi:hypothetical protein